jgi:hypothetical protein
MVQKLKINLINIIRSFKECIIINIIFVGVHIWGIYKFPSTDFSPLYLGMASLVTIPCVYLFIEYWYFNRKLNILIDYNSENFIITKKDQINKYHFSDIKLIELHNPDKGGLFFFPFIGFSYSKIYFNDGVYIYLTSIMLYRLNNSIDAKVEDKKTIFPSILLQNSLQSKIQ